MAVRQAVWSTALDRMSRKTSVPVRVAKAAEDGTACVAAEGSATILNLASKEYYAVIGPHLGKRKLRIISPDFRVKTAKGLSFQSFTAKVARGSLARFVCDERIADPAALEGFDRDGWRFSPDGSTVQVPLFVRAG